MITPDMIPKDAQKEKRTARAILLAGVILLLCLLSVCFLFYSRASQKGALTAYIYQEGKLLETIDLSTVTSPYSFTITAKDGGSNTIEVRPGSIGMIDADCPDRLCVSMGFANSSLLPIVCLPHGLVIQIEPSGSTEPDTVDIITY